MSGVAGDGARVTGRLRELRGQLDAAAGSAAAAGAPEVVAALEATCASCSAALGALDELVERLRTNLGASGIAYVTTDENAIEGG